MDTIGFVRFQPPLPERGLAIRPSALDLLFDRARPVVYLRSGAGTGKTATASLFAARAGHTVWFELEAGDNTLHAFVYGLGQAIRRVLPAFRQKLGLYPLLHPTVRVAHELLDEFLDEYTRLAGAEAPGSAYTVVLDNLTVLDNPHVGVFLQEWILRNPAGLRLILIGASRYIEEHVLSAPGMAVRVVDDAELWLEREEVTQVVGYDADFVWNSSSGWPCAVNSYRLLLQQHRDIDVPVERWRNGETGARDQAACFQGILETLPPSMRAFVQSIRLLDGMTAELCNAQAGTGNAAALLEYLVNNHYYLKKKTGGYYRFYAPFRAYLLQTMPPDTEEYRLAARGLLAAGDALGAGRFAYLAADAALLETCAGLAGERMIAAGLGPELARWLERLPEDCGTLCGLLRVELLVLDRRMDAARPLIERTWQDLRDRGEQEHLVEVMRYRAMLARSASVDSEACGEIDQMQDAAAAVSSEAACLLLADQTCCLHHPQHGAQVAARIGKGLEAARAAGDERLVRMYEWLMIAVHYHKGRFPEVVQSHRAAAGLAAEDLDLLGKAAHVYYVVRALQNMDEFDEARRLLAGWRVTPTRAHALTDEIRNERILSLECLLADLYQERIFARPLRDEMLDPLLERLREFVELEPEDAVATATTRVLEQVAGLIRGADPLACAQIIRSLQKNCLPSVYFSALTRTAAFLLKTDHTAAAAEIIEECFERNENIHLPYAVASLYALMACVAIRNRQDTVAAEYMRISITMAARSRMIALYADRELFEPAINLAVDEGMEPEFVRTVIDRFDYRIKKIYINCFGPFYAAPIKAQDQHLRFRTSKTRELLALLLHNRNRALSKSELTTTLFGDDTIRNNKLLDVTIYYLRAAFRTLDLDNPVQYRDGGYSIFDNQIEFGIPAAANAIITFRRFPGRQTAEALLHAIPDAYMKDFDAPWASVQRDLYTELANLARQTLENGVDKG